MANEPTPLTDEEKYELALQSEAELARLTRTYTIMERNRAEYMQAEGGGKLLKHKKVLNIFKREQKNILTDLGVASDKARIKEDEKRSIKLAYLLDEFDDFDQRIKVEQNYTREIEEQIQMVKRKTLDLAAKQITDDKYQERILRGEQKVRTLENKLDVQIKKFCVICADNVQLREEIHHLLIERTEFNKIWEKLIRNLCVGKKFMIDLIEQATIAYDQREEWVSKLQVLRSKAHNELIAHIQEMRELQRKRDSDGQLQEFFATKCQKRFMKDLESIQLKKRSKHKAVIEQKLEHYLNLLIAIKDFTQQDNMPAIAHQFLLQEEENFAKFKYVNNLNKVMEVLSDSLAQHQMNIEDERVLQEQRTQQQSDDLDYHQKRLSNLKEQVKDREHELYDIDARLGGILRGIDSMFKLFKCNNDPLIRLLGHNETIHHHNALLYLGILERSIHEALVTVHYRQTKTGTPTRHSRDRTRVSEVVRQDIIPSPIEPVEMICETNPCPLCVEHDLVSDVIDELQYAYTKEEIQEKLRKRLEIDGSQAALHNVSACHLPKSRQIIQKRYQ